MGKTHKEENFPVASLLLASEVRSQVLEFYQFARKADDIADNPNLDVTEKFKQLDLKTDNPFLNDLLIAFRQDVVKNRYETWDDLLEYCRFSANPVGQFLLDVHEERNGVVASDALCTALQILNHLQDCQKDYKEMDRIYLPSEFLEDEESFETLLVKEKTSPELRAVLNACLDRTQELLEKALTLPSQIRSKRLRYQAKVTVLCGFALLGKLRKSDPLANRVELTKLDKFLIAYKGLYPL